MQWSKCIWFPEATPRFAFLSWLAVRNRLATGDRILRWNPFVISTCWLCKEELETRDHLFFECIYSKEVWSGTIGNLVGNVCIYQWDRVLQAVVNEMQERHSTFLLRYSFQAVVHVLWIERNVRRVEDPVQPATCLIARMDKLVRNRVTSFRKKNGAKFEKAMEVWFGKKISI